MRVAYVCSDPGVPVFGSKGASIHAQGVLGALVRAGADVDLFATRLGGDPPPALRGITIHAPERPSGPPGGGAHGRSARREGDAAARERALMAANGPVAAAIRDAGPFDLVYERHALFAWAGMTAARAMATPGVLEVNAPLVEEQAAHRTLVDRAAAEAGVRRSLAAADAVVAVSASLADHLERCPQARGRVHVVPNGVDPSRFPPPARQRADRPFTVAFVGTLKPWHGLDTLVDTMVALRATVTDARLLVIGDGPGREGLERALDDAGIAHAAVLTGAVVPDRVGKVLAWADAAIAPYPPGAGTYFSPLKAFEGMAAGLPLVASRVGQLTELVRDGETGVLCRAGDPSAFADALAALARDPARRERIGAAARAWVLRHHTWDHVVAQVLGLVTGPGAARLRAARADAA